MDDDAASIDDLFIAQTLKEHLALPNAVLVVRFRQVGDDVASASSHDCWGVVVGDVLYQVTATRDGLFYRPTKFDNELYRILEVSFWGTSALEGAALAAVAGRIGRLYEGRNHRELYANCHNFAISFANFLCDKHYGSKVIAPFSANVELLRTAAFFGAAIAVAAALANILLMRYR